MSMTSLTTERMLAAFSQEICSRGGRVADTFHDGQRLFVRGILALEGEVKPRDRVQGGVALKGTETDVSVHPYVFRHVCQHGAIMAQSLGGERLENIDWQEAEVAEHRIRELIADCACPEVFVGAAGQFRTAATTGFDSALAMLTMFSQHSTHPSARFLAQIMERFFRHEERTGFGLIQAVTSLARDTRDPQDRWELEELGGSLAAQGEPEPTGGPRLAARQNAEVLVG